MTAPTAARTTLTPADHIHARREQVRELLLAAGVRDARLFGSFARGTARPESDVDLLVELPTPYDGMRYLRLLLALEDLLGCRVDLVPADSLPPLVRAAAERDAVPL
jgi:uncharacterized protein